MSDGLARQCAVIIPALGIALAVVARSLHSDVRRQTREVIDYKPAENQKFPYESDQAKHIRQTLKDLRGWQCASLLTMAYTAAVILGEWVCLSWLAKTGYIAWPFSDSTSEAIYIVWVVMIGLVGILFIPAGGLSDSTLFRQPKRVRDIANKIEEPSAQAAGKSDVSTEGSQGQGQGRGQGPGSGAGGV